MILVDITNLTSLKIDEGKVKIVVQRVVEIENPSKKDKNTRISIVFLGPKAIKKINKTYRGKNRVTDVLCFNFQQDKDMIFGNLEDENLVVAEIFICLKRIRKNFIKQRQILAKDKNFNILFGQEIINVLIHGLLHFLGYDHQNEQQLKKMFNRQKQLFFLVQKENNDICELISKK